MCLLLRRTSAWHYFSMHINGAGWSGGRQHSLCPETEESPNGNRRYRLLTIRRSTNNDVGEESLWAEVVITLEKACQLYGESFLNFSQAGPWQWVGRSRCRPAQHRDSQHVNGVPHPFASGVCNKGKPSEPFAGPAREGLFIWALRRVWGRLWCGRPGCPKGWGTGGQAGRPHHKPGGEPLFVARGQCGFTAASDPASPPRPHGCHPWARI